MRLYQVAGGTTTRFGYDGANAVADYDGSNTLQHRYVFGPGADRPIVQYDGSGTTNREFMGADERGSIVSLTDSSGNLVNVNRYDEYGKPQSTNTGKFQYTGQKWIGEINGYDYKARVYLPHLGIFAQIDPIGYAGSTNLYGYVGANPVNLSDPSGLCPKGEVDVMETGSRLPRCEPVDSGSSSAGSSSGSSGDNTYSGGPQNGEQRGCECVADSNAVAQASINAFHGYYSDGVWNSVGGMQLSSTMLSAAGLYNGIRTFGDNPSYGRPIARFFPNGRITSQGAGGFRGALEDLDYLAQLNGLTPPGPTGFASLPPEGWVWSFNPVSGYQILTNSATGLAFRANGSGVGSYNIDIPAGLRIGAPSLYSALPETVHYTGH